MCNTAQSLAGLRQPAPSSEFPPACRAQGWRFAFFVTAGAAIAAALLLLGLGVEPRLTVRSRAAGGLNRRGLGGVVADALRDLGRSLGTVCRIRSFQVVVLQVRERACSTGWDHPTAAARGRVSPHSLTCSTGSSM